MSTALSTKPTATSSTALKFNNNDSTLLNNNMAAANNLLKTSITGCTLTNKFSTVTTSSSGSSSNSISSNSISSNQNTFKYLTNIISNQRISSICNPNAATVNCQPENDMEESNVKEEPMSPGSSCPPSPNTSAATMLMTTTPSSNSQGPPPQYGSINVNLANMAAYTNTDLVFEHNKVSLGFVLSSIWHVYFYLFGSATTNECLAAVIWILIMARQAVIVTWNPRRLRRKRRRQHIIIFPVY